MAGFTGLKSIADVACVFVTGTNDLPRELKHQGRATWKQYFMIQKKEQIWYFSTYF